MKQLYDGEEYRDDRIFVMDYRIGTVHSKRGQEEKYILTTYRNTDERPPRRSDKFLTKNALFDYIKLVEPDTPLISLDGKPLAIPPNEDKWDHWISWLLDRDLHSAITGHQIYPQRWIEEGIKPYKHEVIEISKEELIAEGLLLETKDDLDEQELIEKGLLFSVEDETKYQ